MKIKKIEVGLFFALISFSLFGLVFIHSTTYAIDVCTESFKDFKQTGTTITGTIDNKSVTFTEEKKDDTFIYYKTQGVSDTVSYSLKQSMQDKDALYSTKYVYDADKKLSEISCLKTFSFTGSASTSSSNNGTKSGGSGSTGTGVDPPKNQPSINPGSDLTVMDIVQSALNVFLVLGGLAIFAMIVYAGFLFVTSQGNADKVTAARNTLFYAIIGIVIVALSFAFMIFLKSQIK